MLTRKRGLATPGARLIAGPVCQKSYPGDNGVVALESPHLFSRSQKNEELAVEQQRELLR